MCTGAWIPGQGRRCQESNSGIKQRQLIVNFNEELLGSDAVKVWKTAPDTLQLAMMGLMGCLNATCLMSCGKNVSCVDGCAVMQTPVCRNGWVAKPEGPKGNGYNYAGDTHMVARTGKSLSPLEVQVNHTLWIPVAIDWDAGESSRAPIYRNCQPNARDPKARVCVNGTKIPEASSITAMIPAALPLGCSDSCPDPPVPGQWCVQCVAPLTVTGVRREIS